MKKLVFISLLMIGVSVFGQKGKQWVDLFNGKNLKGWKVLDGTAEFKVENGELIGVSTLNSPSTFLVTKKTYGDFILEYEMNMDSGLNSGVQIRSESEVKPDKPESVFGYQVECDGSDRRWSAGIYDQERRQWMYPVEYNPEAKKLYKKEQWNKFRVEAVGNKIRTWLNGKPVANLVDDMTPEGFIGLQVHGIGKNKELAGKTIRWRNMRIKPNATEKDMLPMPEYVREVSYLNNTLTEREKEEGWKLLWDGETTKGWKGAKIDGFPEKGWKISNGELIVEKDKGEEAGNGGDIITEKTYGNFILEVDFLITKGANSGIKYFVDPALNKGPGSAIGCEYQLLDNKNHPDAKKGVKGNRTLASLYDLITANGSYFDPTHFWTRFNGINTWNRARIEVHGNKVCHYLNGIKVVEYERNTQMWNALVNYSKYSKWPNFGNAKEGHILLQDHGDEVHFRNIKIKEL